MSDCHFFFFPHVNPAIFELLAGLGAVRCLAASLLHRLRWPRRLLVTPAAACKTVVLFAPARATDAMACPPSNLGEVMNATFNRGLRGAALGRSAPVCGAGTG
jgi:hypothetical protein